MAKWNIMDLHAYPFGVSKVEKWRPVGASNYNQPLNCSGSQSIPVPWIKRHWEYVREIKLISKQAMLTY